MKKKTKRQGSGKVPERDVALRGERAFRQNRKKEKELFHAWATLEGDEGRCAHETD